MKKLKVLSIAIMITLLTSVFSLSANAQTEEIIIQTTAQCGECEEIIEKALLAEKGVKFADLDIESKKVKVIYNAKKTNPDQLRNTIALSGYDADDVPADAEAVKRLDPCCTKGGHRED